MDVLGIPADRFDATLIAELDNFGAAAVAAVEAGADRIEPSHVLIALARMRVGLATSLFAGSHVPVDVLLDALRREAGPGTAVPVTAFTPDTVSAATGAAFADLAARTDSATIGEREVIAALLPHVEPVARTLLEEYGQVDLEQWRTAAIAPQRPPAAVLAADGGVDLDAFTPRAQQVLATLVAEASALGHRELGTLMLLHAMGVAANGLLAQACHFLRHDLQVLRTHVLLLLRGRVHRPVVDVRLAGDAIGPPLRLALQKAAAHAAGRGAGPVAEQDVLCALLDSPVGPIEGVLRGAGIDVGGLRHYATHLYSEYTEPPDREPARSPEPVSVEESRGWLRDNLIGQDHVIARLWPRLDMIKRAARRGYRWEERPLATFLFCGPSGTGKTMTARLIAQLIYGSEDDLIVFEMGQFNSRESINIFIGAPPGYVGFGEGHLTNGLRNNPRSVLLFDEVEKAHPLVLDALLRLLDEGRVNDPAGPVRDARDAVVVLTSNLGAKEFAELGRRRIGQGGATSAPGPARLEQALTSVFGGAPDEGAPDEDESVISAQLRAVLEGFFRPEFLNRIDEMILFAPFGTAELEAIAVAGLRRRAATLHRSLGVDLSWDADVPRHLVRIATTWRVDEAARGVNRCVDEVLQLVLRALDDADESGAPAKAVHAVVHEDKLAVVNADA
ncbi:MAG: AAA family ATPase [Pseudonocardiaceae bacterium]